MVGQIYPTELQLNKANSSDTEAPFLDLNLSITNGIVSSIIYDKWDDFNFEKVNFPFLDGDVPRSPSYGVYILMLIKRRPPQIYAFVKINYRHEHVMITKLYIVARILYDRHLYECIL